MLQTNTYMLAVAGPGGASALAAATVAVVATTTVTAIAAVSAITAVTVTTATEVAATVIIVAPTTAPAGNNVEDQISSNNARELITCRRTKSIFDNQTLSTTVRKLLEKLRKFNYPTPKLDSLSYYNKL